MKLPQQVGLDYQTVCLNWQAACPEAQLGQKTSRSATRAKSSADLPSASGFFDRLRLVLRTQPRSNRFVIGGSTCPCAEKSSTAAQMGMPIAPGMGYAAVAKPRKRLCQSVRLIRLMDAPDGESL